jgi:tetratricopeptide (TPR) repeat protein
MRVVMAVLVALYSTLAAAQGVDESLAAGRTAMQHQDYDAAITAFTRAQEIAFQVDVVFELADAHRLAAAAAQGPQAAAHLDTAIALYQQYVDAHPRDENKEVLARGWLSKLRGAATVTDTSIHEAEREREEREQVTAGVITAGRRTNAENQDQQRVAVTKTKVADELSKSRIVRMSGIGGIAGGVVAAGVGVYFGFRARSLGNELTESRTYDSKKIAEGDKADQNMAIAYSIGGSLLVAGAITYWIGRNMKEHALAAPIAITPLPGGGNIAFSASF